MNPTPTPLQAEVTDLPAAAEAVLAEARAASAGRAGRTLTPGAGAPLKQALLALTEGTVLADHESPGEATLQVLTGHVHLTAGDRIIELTTGGWTPIPPERHGVEALTDAVLLITVAVRQREQPDTTAA
jgi:quercetin dioxygenase-like cupin family protein